MPVQVSFQIYDLKDKKESKPKENFNHLTNLHRKSYETSVSIVDNNHIPIEFCSGRWQHRIWKCVGLYYHCSVLYWDFATFSELISDINTILKELISDNKKLFIFTHIEFMRNNKKQYKIKNSAIDSTVDQVWNIEWFCENVHLKSAHLKLSVSDADASFTFISTKIFLFISTIVRSRIGLNCIHCSL